MSGFNLIEDPIIYLSVVASNFSTKFLSKKLNSLSGWAYLNISSHALNTNDLLAYDVVKAENDNTAYKSDSLYGCDINAYYGIPILLFIPGSYEFYSVLFSHKLIGSPFKNEYEAVNLLTRSFSLNRLWYGLELVLLLFNG
jgi:hypothetical protein